MLFNEAILQTILDVSNHPVVVHCNKVLAKHFCLQKIALAECTCITNDRASIAPVV